jgi:hypothetical protein
MRHDVQSTITARDQNADHPKPHDMDTNLIIANDQAAINAIREAGADQL